MDEIVAGSLKFSHKLFDLGMFGCHVRLCQFHQTGNQNGQNLCFLEVTTSTVNESLD